jgi:8-oxo-dGTP pyrophosphatase MutT (NUDIX family)
MARPKRRRQYAVLPLAEVDGETCVLLLTSRETGRWIIPKGWPVKRMKPWEAAAREAYEEAGLLGSVGREPVGTYLYDKRLDNGRTVVVEVTVFPMAVRQQLEDWPERGERRSRWVTPGQAAMLVEEGGLVDILLEAAQGLSTGGERGPAAS